MQPRNMKYGLIALGLVLSISRAAIATQLLTSHNLRGDGSWRTDGEHRRTAQEWSLDLRRSDDGTVSGLITVTDSPLLQAGIVHGRIDGRAISGTITDDQGKYVARFAGLRSQGSFRGKYVDRTGESGTWEWEGELPR